ncbi:MAG: hypothetical protein ABH967_00930 [Patescibacteria group bacterium]
MGAKRSRSFIVATILLLTLLASIVIIVGNYGIVEKIVTIMVFLVILPQFLNLSADITLPITFQKRKLFIEQRNGGYDALRIVENLNYYFTEQGAIIVNESAAEFSITLMADIIDPRAMNCKIVDQRGHSISFQEYGYYWPRSFALEVARFIRESDQGLTSA